MTSLPSTITRVPTLLASQTMLASIQNTNRNLLRLQAQLASGQAVNRPSDDAVATSAISVLDDTIERRDQRLRNLGHAQAVLDTGDAAVSDASNLVLEAHGIGLSQIGIGSDPEIRANQATVIDAMLQELTAIANREFQDIHLFGGSATGAPPLTELHNGLRYEGTGEGLVTDLGLSRAIAITSAGEDVFGALSARVSGDRDLNPQLTPETRLVDLNGAIGAGIRLGSIAVDVDGTALTVDLTGADRVQDVIDALQSAIQSVDPGATVQIDAGGHALRIDPSFGSTVTISDLGGEATASDLGLTGTFGPLAGLAGVDLDAQLTPLTPLTALSGLALPLGTIRLSNGGQTRDLDLSSAQTVQDIVNAVEGLDLGIRVEIAAGGDRLNFINELSGSEMSVGEVGGGTTARDLGVRSLTGTTALADFNHGLGVEIVSGNVDPVSGVPDPARDLDFEVILKDGRRFSVDLAGAATVQDVLDLTNAAATAAGILVPGEFEAGLAPDGNGIALTDTTAGTTTTIAALNQSRAAEQLGILGSTDGATLLGADRATVAVDSVFSHLIALRDALQGDDERGISLATQQLEADMTRLASARANIGVRSRRVSDAVSREEDLRLQEIALRSEVQDLDFTEAAIRFATLQQQLQAGLTTASQVTSLSLLDFLR